MPRKHNKWDEVAPGLYHRRTRKGGRFVIDLSRALRAAGAADTVGNRLALSQALGNLARAISRKSGTKVRIEPDLPENQN